MIAFALQPDISQVICIDLDRNKLRMLAHNASIYGVDPTKLVLVLADTIIVLRDYYRQGQLVSDAIAGTAETDVDDAEGKKCKSESDLPLGYVIGGVELLPPHIDAVYLSPPWGGPAYASEGKKGLNLEDFVRIESLVPSGSNAAANTETKLMVDGLKLLQLASNATEDGRNIIYFLPRNINGISVGKAVASLSKQLRKKGDVVELEQNIVNGKLKTVTAYIGQSSRNKKLSG